MSFFIAIFALIISFKRYDAQMSQYELSKKEIEEKKASHFQIQNEQLVPFLGEKEPKYFAENPHEREFIYKAKYINKGESLIEIKHAVLVLIPEDTELGFIWLGEVFLSKQYMSPHEEIKIKQKIEASKINQAWRLLSLENEKEEREGVVKFEILIEFSGLDKIEKKHKRTLYRMAPCGGDQSRGGYTGGQGHLEHTFVY